MSLGAIVLNRTLSPSLRQPAAAKAARQLSAATEDPAFVGSVAKTIKADVADTRAVLAEISERFHDIAIVASREAERRSELESIGALTVTTPALDHDVTDLTSLLELGGHLTARP
jgi:hypothetical protein